MNFREVKLLLDGTLVLATVVGDVRCCRGGGSDCTNVSQVVV